MTAEYRIMVVDDEPDILAVVCSVLEQCDKHYIVKGFSRPDEALDFFRTDPKAFDLVLTDIRMPGVTGFTLAAKLKSTRPDIAVAFMSAFDVDEHVPGYPPSLRKNDVIRKPSGLIELCKLLERYLPSLA